MGNQIRRERVKTFYKLDEEIAGGSFGRVYRAHRKVDGKEVAIKIIQKKDLKPSEIAGIYHEVQIMGKINHPHCVKFFQFFESKTKFSVVMEYLAGGEVFDRVIQESYFSEELAARVLKEAALALRYLHSIGIVHRDIKPENLLFSRRDDSAPIKLVDFGLAKYKETLTDDTLMLTSCGTPQYAAPELLIGKGYTKAIDMWSLGVVLYVMITGGMPFKASTKAELYRKIKKGEVEFSQDYWSEVSDAAKEMMCGLLRVDAKQRYTPEHVLTHRWIIGDVPRTPKAVMSPYRERDLTTFKGSKFQKSTTQLCSGSRMGLSFDDEDAKVRKEDSSISLILIPKSPESIRRSPTKTPKSSHGSPSKSRITSNPSPLPVIPKWKEHESPLACGGPVESVAPPGDSVGSKPQHSPTKASKSSPSSSSLSQVFTPRRTKQTPRNNRRRFSTIAEEENS